MIASQFLLIFQMHVHAVNLYYYHIPVWRPLKNMFIKQMFHQLWYIRDDWFVLTGKMCKHSASKHFPHHYTNLHQPENVGTMNSFCRQFWSGLQHGLTRMICVSEILFCLQQLYKVLIWDTAAFLLHQIFFFLLLLIFFKFLLDPLIFPYRSLAITGSCTSTVIRASSGTPWSAGEWRPMDLKLWKETLYSKEVCFSVLF